MAEIKGINGEGLGIDSSIYDDCRTVGNRDVFIESLRTGMFSFFTADEMQCLLASFGMTPEELRQLQQQWQVQTLKVAGENESVPKD